MYEDEYLDSAYEDRCEMGYQPDDYDEYNDPDAERDDLEEWERDRLAEDEAMDRDNYDYDDGDDQEQEDCYDGDCYDDFYNDFGGEG